MNAPFNPYLKWLGIPLKDQPPNHYRLLGVELFEADADIIERAADRQMTYLRSLQTGEHADEAQQLLNEVSAAKVCLLKPGKRTPYDETLQLQLQEKGLRPKAAPRIGEPAAHQSGVHAAAKPAVAKAPPPRRKPSASGSNIGSASAIGSGSAIGSASGVGLKTAQPLDNSGSAIVPAVAVTAASASNGVKPASAAKGQAPVAKADVSNSGSMIPLLIGLVGGGIALLLMVAVVAFLFWPTGSDKPIVADNSNPNTSLGGGSYDSNSLNSVNGGRNNASTSGNGGRFNTPGQSTGSASNSNTNNTTHTTGNGNSGSGNGRTTGGPRTGNSNNSSKSHLLVEAPFLIGTLEVGSQPLSDRDYSFSEVDADLRGLDFTRWPYGPVQPFKFSVERAGPVYMILPPEQYARPLPNINVSGWKHTSLKCNIRVAGGLMLPCKVYMHEGRSGAANVSAGSAIWPILAAGRLEKKARILGDVVNNDSDSNNSGSSTTGNSNSSNNTTNGGNNSGGNTEIETKPDVKKPPAVVKLAVPATTDQKVIHERVAEVFELSSLSTTEEKVAAAKRIFAAGREPNENSVERYVMLSTAARIAGEAGDLVTALQSVDEIDKHYDADTPPMRLYLVGKFAKARIPKNLKVAQLQYVVNVLDNGLANDQFDAVDETVTDLSSAGLVHKELTDRRKIAREMKGKYRKVAVAKETLKGNPDDGEANRIVGEYVSYNKLNWDAGLPMLAKSDDPQLQRLAETDLSNPKAAAEQVRIADGWFDIAQSQESDLAKGALLTRAEDWYRKALDDLKGLDEAHAKKRLDEIKDALVDHGWVDVPKKATIAARSGYSCEIYHNGQEILDASYDVGTAKVTLKRGDFLFVRARRSSSTLSSSSYSKGFGCVIAFEGSNKPILTGHSKGWQAFLPSSTIYWYKPENVARTMQYVISPGVGHLDLAQQTGVQARSIWSTADSSTSYFVYRVP